MNTLITPLKLHGKVTAVSSKSQAHRILICAAFSKETTTVQINSIGEDIKATIECLLALGAHFSIKDDSITVFPIEEINKAPILNCFESGTTLRFFDEIVSALSLNAKFELSESLKKRPRNPSFELSSQSLSGKLLCAPLLNEDFIIEYPDDMPSFGYVEMTVDVLRQFGIEVKNENNKFFISKEQYYKSPGFINVEGDWSNSAYWIAANYFCENIEIENLNSFSYQPDKCILNLINENDIDINQCPDLISIISVIYSLQENKTSVIRNLERLKIKESNRINSTFEMLTNLGADIKIINDTFVIYGKNTLLGGTVNSYNDHRIAMSASIASTRCENSVTILDSQCIKKSYPSFYEDFIKLGGRIDVI